MSAISNDTHLKRGLRSMFAERSNFINEETIFCKWDNLEQSLHILNEVMRHSQ